VSSLLTLVEKLVTMATTGKLVTVTTTGKRGVTTATAGKTSGHDSEADVVTVQQLALFGLKLMCKILGAQHPKEFAKVRDRWILLMMFCSFQPSLSR